MPQIPSSSQPIRPTTGSLSNPKNPPIPNDPSMPLVQAYVVQKDNTRVALPAGQSLESLDWLGNADQNAPLARLEAHFDLQDIDGIDQKSSFDLKGDMDLTLKLERKLFEQAVSQANQQNDNFDFGLSFNAKNSTYTIPIKYKSFAGKIKVAEVNIRPMSNGRIKVEVGGLAGGAASVLNGLSFGTLKTAVQGMIKDMSKDMGFKVQANTISDYVLSPDIENSPLFTLDKVNTPILIMANDDDTMVPWYQGIEYFIGLRRLGKPAWLLNYNEAEHWPTKMRDRIDFQIRLAQFFAHYLKGEPMPKWMKEGIPATEKGIEMGYDLMK